jgi:uncharacterized repeat protein (TIGR01451 family)
MTKTLLLAAAAAVLITQGPARAGEASLTAAVFREVEVRSPDGRVTTDLKPASRVTPGDQVVYVLTYRNGAAKPAEGVVVINPLAKDLVYAGPADARPPMVSVDGETFGPLTTLIKTAQGASPAPASAADVTTLRWRLDQPVPAGGEVRLSFRARLK